MQEQLNKKYIRCCIATFMLLFLPSSFVVVYDFVSSGLTIFLWIATALFIMFDFDFKFSLKTLTVFLLLVIFIWASVLINNENIVISAKITFGLFVAFLYANSYNFNQLYNAFLLLMKVLCTISILGFLVFLFYPSLSAYNVIVNTNGYAVNNLYIYVHSVHNYRNLGMFWEPGALGVFTNLALFLELRKKDLSILSVLIYVVTIVTTFSTTAFIGLAVLLIYFLFNLKRFRLSTRWCFLFMLAVLALVVLANYNYLIKGVNSVFGKVLYFLRGGESISAEVRFNSVTKAIEATLKAPIFGLGKNGLGDFAGGMATCTMLNWFGAYGVFFGSLMLVGFCKFAKFLGKTFWKTLFCFAFVFLITFSEDLSTNAFMLLIGIYGYDSGLREEAIQELQDEKRKI